MKKKPLLKKHIPIWPFLLLAVSVILFAFIWVKSVIVRSGERINVVVYGQKVLFLSIGIKDGVNYYTQLPADSKITVPGGYGEYRIGAIGKLAYLEKNIDIYKKGFSAVTGTFVDLYFYPKEPVIYYEDKKTDAGLKDIGISTLISMGTNGTLVDKMYVFNLLKNQKDHFKKLNFTGQEEFYRKYQGYFYDSDFRKERKVVQMLYGKKYNVALRLGNLLQNVGVNVSDITKSVSSEKNRCLVREKTQPHSLTAIKIAEFFDCSIEKGNTDLYDIIIQIGSLEDGWE